MYNIETNVTPAGLKVIMSESHANPLISLMVFVRVGSCWEKPEEAGFSHFLEHLVFKSTRDFPDGTISEKAAFYGGTLNAYTEYDSTCFFITLPSRYTREGLHLLSQLVCHTQFDDEEFEFERKVVLEELKQYRNDPEEFFLEQIPMDYFTDNPLRNPIIGNEKTLLAATPDDLKRFHHHWYVPNNAYVVACGDLQPEALTGMINEFFNDWKPAKVQHDPLPQDPLPVKTGFKQYKRKLANGFLAFCIPDFSDTNEDFNAYNLAIKAFAQGKNSRLYQRLFEKEKLIDGMRLHSFSGVNDGMAILMVNPKKGGDLYRIIGIVREEMEDFYRFGMKSDELDRIKTESLHQHRYTGEYAESLGMSLGNDELTIGWEGFVRTPEILSRITEADTRRVIRKYLYPDVLQVYYMGKEQLKPQKIFSPVKRETVSKRSVKGDCEFTTLSSGMKVCLKKVTGKPTIGIAVGLASSQLNEREGNRGINQLASTLLMHGNQKRNYRQMLQYCSDQGIVLGVSNQLETTTIRCKCFEDKLFTALDLLHEVLSGPLFPNDHLHNIRNTVISSLNRIKDYPQQYSSKLWKEMTFGRHSNLLHRYGRIKDLREISRKRIIEWYQAYYSPSRMVISIVGDMPIDETIEYLEKTLAHLPNDPQETLPQEALVSPSENRHRRKDTGLDQSIIQLGGFGCRYDDREQNTAFYVLSQILGGDLNSRLYNELREKRGLAYSVDFDFQALETLGYFRVWAQVNRDGEKESLDVIHNILEKCKTNSISEQELETARNAIRGSRLQDDESVLHQATTIALLESLGLGYEYFLDREKRLENVSLDHIREIARKYFVEDNFYTYILS